MNRVNTFFWSRLNPTGELVRSVDVLLRELVPDDKLDAAFESLSIAASSSAGALAECKPQGDEPADEGAVELSDDACEPDLDGEDPPAPEEESSDEEATEKTVPGELERKWAKIRAVFHDWDEEQTDREKKMDDMAELLLRYRVLEKVLMPKVLGQLTFETRKYVGNVFRAMTVHNLRGFIELIAERPDIMRWLVDGYKNNDTALICGSMLRDCFEYQTLTMIFLQDLQPEFEFLFKVTMENSNFDISADALINISRLLTVHKKATVQVLDASFDRIFGLLNGLLASENYATRRQALQLLSELLLDPVNFTVMQRYVTSRNNLKQIMLLLREPSEALRMDAFHVFKIFVANPNKSPEVEQLLVRNHEKLLAFVSDFGKSESNRDFLQERSLLVFALERMAEKQHAQERALEQVTRPASLSDAEPMPLATSAVSEVCANLK
jgi:calcium binding protein 39